MTQRRFEQISPGMFVDAEYAGALGRLGLTDIETVFAFDGTIRPKDNMAPHRGRCCFALDGPAVKVFMKRYDKTMILLFAANNFRLEGLQHLIRAVCAAQSRHPARPIPLVIAGSGKQRPFVKLAEKLRINDKITFLGGVTSIASPAGRLRYGSAPDVLRPVLQVHPRGDHVCQTGNHNAIQRRSRGVQSRPRRNWDRSSR